MRLKAGLIVCGLLAAINVQAKMYYGPTPNVSTRQEYELPSGAPADVYLWKEDYPGTSGYYDAVGTYKCAYSDVQQTCSHQSGRSTIIIVLKEKRSGMTHSLKLQAYMTGIKYNNADPSQSESCNARYALNNQTYLSCSTSSWSIVDNARVLTAWIPQSEMNNLPVGGVWEGALKLQYNAAGRTPVNFVANITLKGKATGKQDIFFPEFNNANPLVQLDLHPTGAITGNSFAEDVTTLDMCLYDGYNSNSDSMKLSFADENKGGASRKNGYYSIYNTGTAGTGENERIDYRLEMFNPHTKSWMRVDNGQGYDISAGVNGQDQVRPVHLPSISYPVLCAPAPLRLIVDKFRVTDKTAGYYKGTLQVYFSPSLNSI